VHDVNTVAAGLNPARWLRARAGRRPSAAPHPMSAPPASPKHMRIVSRLVVISIVVVVSVSVVGSRLGYRLARQSDEQLSSQQHVALRNAISEFSTPIRGQGEIDPRLLRAAEQIVGIKNLRFESSPSSTRRESQPVVDVNGRIAGFLTWDKVSPVAQTMNRLAPVAIAVACILLGLAALSLWQLRRARYELSVREFEAARAADLDKLTGLPNHAKMLELLDLALAERSGPDHGHGPLAVARGQFRHRQPPPRGLRGHDA